MTAWPVPLPILLPIGAALVCLALRHQHRLQSALSLVLALMLVFVGIVLIHQTHTQGPLVAQMGHWAAPLGITLFIDRLSAVLVFITGLMGFATLLYAKNPDPDPANGPLFPVFVHGLLAGVCGAFITGDIFNLYVWFEVMMMASFALMALGAGKRRLAGAMVYLVLNLVATLLFLACAGLLYGATGTLNLADLARYFAQPDAAKGAHVAAALMLLAFGIKAALFPVFGWLPASYPVAWAPVSALFAGLLTKVGVYALIRIVTLFWPEPGLLHQGLLWVACLTMLIGVLGAAAQKEIRRILSFHIVSQVGYMVLGLALLTPLALAGAVFYLIHHIVVKANLFLVGAMGMRMNGTERLPAMGGLYAGAPWLALLFAVPALSLAGIPPLSGFWAKFLIVKASLDTHAFWAAGLALLTGFFTLLSMSKIWNEAFMKRRPQGDDPVQERIKNNAWAFGAMSLLCLFTVVVGLWVGPIMAYAMASAEELLNPSAYIHAVFTAQGR
jgi:multicomponent Na+:H+ antiporter subunit D